jgi:hypothetical protein
MKRIIGLTLALFLMGLFFVDTARSENHKFKVTLTTSLNGVELKPGTYRLNLNGENEAQIYKGRKLLVTAEVETVPLAKATPNSLVQKTTGELKEIRLEKERIVFLDTPQDLQARR